MRVKVTVLFVVAALSCLSSFAQSSEEVARLFQKLEGTISVGPHRETADGVLRSCGLEFVAMKRDFGTKQGSPTKIVGSFYLRPDDKNGLVYILKLGVFDDYPFDKAIAPNNAFISAPNGRIPSKATRVGGENPGFALFIGGLDEAVLAAYKAIIEKKNLAVGFNRQPGLQDVVFLIDLTVVDTQMKNDGEVVRRRSGEPVEIFAACAADMLKKTKIPAR